MKALLIAEHDNQILKPANLPMITAAKQCADQIILLVAGFNCADVARQASMLAGVSAVWFVDDKNYETSIAENVSALILSLMDGIDYCFAPATTMGKNILPRVAAKLDVAMISDMIEVVSPDTFVRPIYAGNALQTVQSSDRVKIITVRTTAFDPAKTQNQAAPIESKTAIDIASTVRFVKHELSVSTRPELSSAKIVVSGGRGLQNKENFALIEQLADQLGAAVGASRAAVDAGFVPNDFQVGQTGKVVAPELYIAIGISGAIQHIAGMKDSKVIVAINKDPEAPIFSVANYGLVGDLFEVIPKLCELLRSH